MSTNGEIEWLEELSETYDIPLEDWRNPEKGLTIHHAFERGLMKKIGIKLPEKSTDVLCFKCKKRNGTECPGRKEGESTLCVPCFKIQMLTDKLNQAQHLLNLLNNEEISREKFDDFIEDIY